MKKTYTITLILLLNLLFIHISQGQNQVRNRTYNQNNFEKNKIFDETYHLRWYKNNWLPNVKDTLPYFVDDRNYKGAINYGLKFRRKDHTNFTFLENVTMYFLKVEFTKCDFNPKDSITSIEGFVSGGWGDELGKKVIEKHIDVFLGQITDTIRACSYGNAFFDNILD